MPHTIVKAQEHQRFRGLGRVAVRWIEHFVVHGTGDIMGRSMNYGVPGAIPLSDELTMLTYDCYALGGQGARLYDSVFFSRPKGADKSGHASRIALYEALGPCRFDGWAEGGEVYEWMDFRHEYEPGEAMGRRITYPFLRILATEEGQTGNVYDSIYYNLKEGPLSESFARKDDVGLTRIYLPGGGEIRPSTASSSAKDGGKETWANFDETHLYTLPELRRMYDTVRRNMTKRKESSPWSFESSTMYQPGQNSVAEASHKMAMLMAEGGKVRPQRFLFDHREAPADTDILDDASLRAGLAEAYGDSWKWQDQDRKVSEIQDLRNDTTDSRRFSLNQVTAAYDAWITPQQWDVCAAPEKKVEPGEEIAIGLDPSDTDDHTVLMGCRISDSHMFPIGIWDPSQHGGKVPMPNVDHRVEWAFANFDVVAFYADVNPAQSYIDRWSEKYGDELCVKATAKNAIGWDMRSLRETTRAVEAYHTAIVEKDLTHSGDRQINQYHYNARRNPNSQGVTFQKGLQTDKIDGAASGALARKARQDYLALPANKKRRRKTGRMMYA